MTTLTLQLITRKELTVECRGVSLSLSPALWITNIIEMTHFTPTFHCISGPGVRLCVFCVMTELCIEVLHESHSAVHCCCLSHITTTRGLSRPVWSHCRPRARLSWTAGVARGASQTNGVFQRRPPGRTAFWQDGGGGEGEGGEGAFWLEA